MTIASSAILCSNETHHKAISWRPTSPNSWTLVGSLAIPLWATWPALALRALEVPVFECLTIAFLIGWLLLAAIEKPGLRNADTSWRSWIPAVACAFGLSGSNAFHILATHFIPAAEANLVSYLWPVEIIALGVMFGLFLLSTRQVLGLLFGFAGAVILMRGGTTNLSWAGIGLAFISGLSWAAYCVFRLRWKGATHSVLSRSCLLSAIACACLHGAFEPTVMPSPGALAAAAAIGLVPLALGNYVWDEGFRRGDSQLLAVLAYATPLVSALLLVALGMEAFTSSLATGAIFIVLAGYLARTDS